MPYPVSRPDGSLELTSLESLASGAALKRRGSALAATPAGAQLLALASGDPAAVDAATVFAAARADDAAARGLIDEQITYLAWGLSCLACALNPRQIIVGGGLSRSADLFFDALRDRVNATVPFAPDWFLSALGDEAVALGAVHQATAMVENSIFEALTTKELS